MLERSADQAGFFESGKTKLIMPALVQAGCDAARDTSGSVNADSRSSSTGNGTGSGTGGGNGGQNDPLIKALIQKLPSGGKWPVDDRINWLKMLVMGFQVAYGADVEIEIKKKEAAN